MVDDQSFSPIMPESLTWEAENRPEISCTGTGTGEPQSRGADRPLVSAVIPCLNEEQTLGICIGKAFAAFAARGIRGEVIVGDNGSTDRSVEIAKALSLDARVAPRTPDSTSKPWIRVTVIDDGDSTVGHDHLIEYMVQLDCYAGNTAMAAHTAQAEASLLYRTARAVLKAKEGMQVDSVVVTSVECRGTRVPDTSAEPARERFIATATVMAHAVSGA